MGECAHWPVTGSQASRPGDVYRVHPDRGQRRHRGARQAGPAELGFTPSLQLCTKPGDGPRASRGAPERPAWPPADRLVRRRRQAGPDPEADAAGGGGVTTMVRLSPALRSGLGRTIEIEHRTTTGQITCYEKRTFLLAIDTRAQLATSGGNEKAGPC